MNALEFRNLVETCLPKACDRLPSYFPNTVLEDQLDKLQSFALDDKASHLLVEVSYRAVGRFPLTVRLFSYSVETWDIPVKCILPQINAILVFHLIEAGLPKILVDANLDELVIDQERLFVTQLSIPIQKILEGKSSPIAKPNQKRKIRFT